MGLDLFFSTKVRGKANDENEQIIAAKEEETIILNVWLRERKGNLPKRNNNYNYITFFISCQKLLFVVKIV